MKKVVVSALIALGLGSVGSVAAEQYQPAGFGADTLSYLEAAVAPPVLTDAAPVAAVYCQTDVGTDGLTRNVSCYEREGFRDLRDQVEQAMAGRQFTAAQIDGEPVPVRMVFRVIYADLDGQPPIMLLPNLGHMQGDFGHQYHAPQERLDSRNWYALYRRNDWSEGQPFFSDEGELTRVLAWVNDSGRVTSARSLEGHSEYRRDANAVEKALEASRFIPGLTNGKPEKMRYVAVLHYPR
ncbi:hypothetical protein [Marinimicrobium locisalis]|uniref:hypothetical protein n=1 Tax=Marinimicrobium locisalis TaxID=546022 RepID=UPI003221B846